MLNVTKEDVDNACAGYARATQEYPRREGIRCALLATRQLTLTERHQVLQGVERLRQRCGAHAEADTILRLLGLSEAELIGFRDAPGAQEDLYL